MLEVVKVSQEIEVVGFFQNLLVPLHAANGLAVFKDLDGLNLVTLLSLRLDSVDLKMDLKEEQLSAGELFAAFAIISSLTFVFKVDLARGKLDQLIFNNTRELTSFRQSSAVLVGEAEELQARLEQLTDKSLRLLEVEHHADVQVYQS